MIQLGITGWPLGHTLSPRLHGAALRALGLEGDYGVYPVDPQETGGLEALLGWLRNGEIKGINVTIPLKQAVLPLLDELSPSAAAIGAVNTILSKDGRLIGHNTDAPGFLLDLKNRLGSGVIGGDVLVLGAGGSARAVIWALAQSGSSVTVAARRPEQVAALQTALAMPGIASARLGETGIDPLPRNCSLIVNTTPLGMSPRVENSPWPAELPFPAGSCVYDLIYNPRETLLMKQARAAGLRAECGLGMLVEQAALAFEFWTGRSAPRQVMFEAVEA